MTPTSDLDFSLPPGLVTGGPLPFRGKSRMLVLDRTTGKCEHRRLADLPEYARGLQVWVNNSKLYRGVVVLWRDTGHRAEAWLKRKRDDRTWEATLAAATGYIEDRRAWYLEADGSKVEILEVLGPQRVLLGFEEPADLEMVGHLPVLSWVRRPKDPAEYPWYEPLYAREVGTLASPTAGVSLDPDTLGKLDLRELTLHIDIDGLRRIETAYVEQHEPFSPAEPYRIADPPAGKVLAVGTTVVKALETWARTGQAEGRSTLLVYEGFEFKATAAFLTNFHFPREKMLAMTAAFGGTENVRRAYREAIAQRYRFADYGDSMLIV